MDGVSSVFKLTRLAASSVIAERRACALSVGLEALGIGLGTLSPFLLKQVIDSLSRPAAEAIDLWVLVVMFVVSWAGSGFVSALRAAQSTRITSAIARHLTTGALRGALPTAVRQRDADSSRLLGQIERLPFSLVIIMDGLVWSSFPMLVQVTVSLVVAAMVLPSIEIVVLGVVLVAFAAVSFFSAVQHQKVAKASNAAASQASHLLGDVVRNGRRVVLNGNLQSEIDIVDAVLLLKARRQMASAWSLAQMSGLQFVTLSAGLIFLLGLAVFGVERGQMTIGGLVLLQAYATRMILPLGSFGFIFSHAGEALANAGDILNLQGTCDPPGVAVARAPVSALVEVKSLCFRYDPESAGIEGVDVEFPPGSITAIVGANGSGKSTFAQLLAGIITPQSGLITINGVDLQSIPPAQRHHWVLYVPQSVGLFNRTLAENALYPPTCLSLEALQARLTAWGFYESGRIVDLSVPVGELGEKLSGGQIQKLELARISGARSALLILDESTSALDPPAEVRIIEDLRSIFVGRTSLVLITHRPASAAIADQVVWLSGGRVAAVGEHADLMRANAAYRTLWAAEPGHD